MQRKGYQKLLARCTWARDVTQFSHVLYHFFPGFSHKQQQETELGTLIADLHMLYIKVSG